MSDNSRVESVTDELASGRALLRRVAAGELVIGRMPPRPPTLRGWMGAVLVRIMRRPLQWLTSQMREFQLAAARQIDSQADALENLSRLGLENRLSVLERGLEGVRQEILRYEGTGDRLNRLSEIASIHDSKFEVNEDRLNRLSEVASIHDSKFEVTEDRLNRLSEIASIHDSTIDIFRLIVPELREKLHDAREGVEVGQREIARLSQDFGQIAALQTEVSTLREQLQRTEGWQSEVAEIRAEGKKTSQAVGALEMSRREFAAFRQAMDGLPNLVREADRRGHQLQRELAYQERRLSIALEELRTRSVGAAADAVPVVGVEEFLDPMYVHFEDIFRGTREDIRQRFEVYLPVLKQANAGTTEMPVLDLGCGRGEWLELLSWNGMSGGGVDGNQVMVALCQELNLSVVRHDLVTYLRSLRPESIGAITGFHVVEHLPFPILMAMIDEVTRVLRPGGICIFETPNPANLRVGACTFYLDPTHRNPIPKELLSFLLEARGLCRIETMELHPYPESFRLPEDGLPSTQLLNDMLFGNQDYAVIGHKL